MAPARRPRTLVAHDQDVIRAGIAACLRSSRRVTLIGATPDSQQALELARDLQPDIALVSTDLGDGSHGLLRALQRATPSVQLVAIVRHVTPAAVAEALRSGAVGVVEEAADAQALLEAVLAAGGSRHLVSGPTASALIGRLERRQPAPLARRLTPRQHDILRLMARGLSSPEIAVTLGIRPATVRLHVRQILRRLGAATRTQAVSRAYRLGLVQLD
jgi:DNA-binding NarL/FixJ family response regulator